MNWDWMVKQLQGEKVALAPVEGRKIIRVGSSPGSKNSGARPGRHDELVLELLRENGPLSTPDLCEETALAGQPVPAEQLLKICKKLEQRGYLLMTKVQRAGGIGKGVNVWQLRDCPGTKP